MFENPLCMIRKRPSEDKLFPLLASVSEIKFESKEGFSFRLELMLVILARLNRIPGI